MGNSCYQRLVFLPPRKISQWPPRDAPSGSTFAYVRPAHGGKIPIVLFRQRSPILILFSHGNATDLGEELEFLKELATRLGVNVCGYEYTGYGASRRGGRPSDLKVCEDINAAYQHCTTELGFSPRDVILMGQSVGSGPTVDFASRIRQRRYEKPAGVILLSPLLSGISTQFGEDSAKVVQSCCCCVDVFPNHSKAEHIRAPVLIIHGDEDEVVPFYHGEALADIVDDPVEPLWIEGAGHNDMFDIAADDIYDRISTFIRREMRDKKRAPYRRRDSASSSASYT